MQPLAHMRAVAQLIRNIYAHGQRGLTPRHISLNTEGALALMTAKENSDRRHIRGMFPGGNDGPSFDFLARVRTTSKRGRSWSQGHHERVHVSGPLLVGDLSYPGHRALLLLLTTTTSGTLPGSTRAKILSCRRRFPGHVSRICIERMRHNCA
jgi:hypothetical protein